MPVINSESDSFHRYKTDFDRSQTSHSSDLQPYCTPQKTFATPAVTPSYRQNGKICDITAVKLLSFDSPRCKIAHSMYIFLESDIFEFFVVFFLLKTVLFPLSPLDSRLEDLQERYNHELEERKRLEAELKIMQVKVRETHNINRR